LIHFLSSFSIVVGEQAEKLVEGVEAEKVKLKEK
jgi:hypothetical protein